MERIGIQGVDKVFIATTQEPGTSSADVSMMPHGELALWWPQLLEIIEEKGSRMLSVSSPTEIYMLLCNGVLDCWLGRRTAQLDGLALCAWEVHDRARYYHIMHLMGDNLRLYLNKGLPLIEHYAYEWSSRCDCRRSSWLGKAVGCPR